MKHWLCIPLIGVSLLASASQPKGDAQQAWVRALTAKIEANWIRSGSEEPVNYPCKVRIVINRANGEVAAAFCPEPCSVSVEHSVLKAVYASSPLPLPDDPEAFVPVVTVSFRPPPDES